VVASNNPALFNFAIGTTRYKKDALTALDTTVEVQTFSTIIAAKIDTMSAIPEVENVPQFSR